MYEQKRRIVIVFGLLVLGALAALMWVRGVDRVEVVGTILFIPVFLAFMTWGVRGGLGAGIAAAATYAWLRWPAMQLVGEDRFIDLIVARSAAYLAFGVLGGWANEQLQGSLAKLELYDLVDDLTGLGNARAFLQEVDTERARAERYGKVFSVVQAALPGFDAGSARRRRRILQELGRRLRGGVRAADTVVHAIDGETHLIAIILPETGGEGARIFADGLVARLGEFFGEQNVDYNPAKVVVETVTIPGGDAELDRLVERYRAIDRRERPSLTV